jgi:hypothetical protein
MHETLDIDRTSAPQTSNTKVAEPLFDPFSQSG